MILRKRPLLITLPFVITLIYIIIMEKYIPRIEEALVVSTEYDIYNYSFLDEYLAKFNDNWRNLSDKEINSLSKLGRILYLNETPTKIKEPKAKYKILMWQYQTLLATQLVYDFWKYNPFNKCSVSNCVLSFDDNDLEKVDVVLIHMRSNLGINRLPPSVNRSVNQIWIFSTEEGPFYTLMHSKSLLKEYNGIFNWTMTYRMDADIPIPYGRTLLKNSPERFDLETEFNEWLQTKNRSVLVAIMGSNCFPKNDRWEYVEQLQNYMDVDDYGRCGKLQCAGHIDLDCSELDKYLFYLSFENSNCDDYVTEKVWWHAYHRNSIPIIMGPKENNLRKLLPYHSYINIREYADPKRLAEYLLYLNDTLKDLVPYLAWKARYKIVNEHGYFGSNNYFYCRMCQALNYNSKEHKVYDDIDTYWGMRSCYPAWEE